MRKFQIRKLREAAGYTQEYVAQCLGVARCSVTQWELGYKYPRASQLPKLAELFRCSIDDLFADSKAS